MKYTLVHVTTKRPVKFPIKVKDFRGDPHELVGARPPRHAGSTGRVDTKTGSEYYPSVFDMEWLVEGSH